MKQFSAIFAGSVDSTCIAKTVLLPGDPLRARYIAERYLENCVCYNEVRGMYGFTGTYRGKRISVQGTGMGIPSSSMYYHDLITIGEARNLIRIGTAGCMSEKADVRDIILATSASTNSSMNKNVFSQCDYAATADFGLLKMAYDTAASLGIKVSAERVLTDDSYYHLDSDFWKIWAQFGVVACDMETAALYTIAAQFEVKALSILSISNSLITNDEMSVEEREKSLTDMIKLALEIAE